MANNNTEERENILPPAEEVKSLNNTPQEKVRILTPEEEIKCLKNILHDPDDYYSWRLLNLHHGFEEA